MLIAGHRLDLDALLDALAWTYIEAVAGWYAWRWRRSRRRRS